MVAKRAETQKVGKESIIEAGRAEFAAAGFHGAKMREISNRAGVSQGLLHHHFGGKEALWSAIGDQALAEFSNYVTEAINLDSQDPSAIAKAMETYLRYWREHPDAFRLNMWRQLEGPAEERSARSKTLNTRIVPFFKRAQDAGILRDDMPVGLLMCVIGALIQFWLHSQVELQDAIEAGGGEMPDDEQFLDYLLKLVSR